jgi:hypothetical protein
MWESIIRRMCFAWCRTKATDTHSEYVILTAFSWQQWLNERAKVLRLYGTLFTALYSMLIMRLSQNAE